MPTTYTVTQAADRLVVSTSTIRRFADTFAPELPDYGKLRKGQRRELTENDLRYILALYQLMEEKPPGYSREDLLRDIQDKKEQLVIPAALPSVEELQRPSHSEPATNDQLPPAQPPATITPAQLETFTAVLQRLSASLDNIEQTTALNARIDALRDAQDRQIEQLARQVEELSRRTYRPWLWIAIGAFVSALVILAAVAVALANGWIG